MRRYFLQYLDKVEKEMNDDKTDLEKLRVEHLVQIEFMQHERFIHLIVTCLIAVLLIMTMIGFIVTKNLGLLIIIILFIAMLIPYIWHYFFMENNVQKLYTIYNKIVEKLSNR